MFSPGSPGRQVLATLGPGTSLGEALLSGALYSKPSRVLGLLPQGPSFGGEQSGKLCDVVRASESPQGVMSGTDNRGASTIANSIPWGFLP